MEPKKAELKRVEAPKRTEKEAPRRGVRAGTLMDTGDAMPNTDFRRPNPLDSDTIMDATARMLSSRRSLLSSILPKGGEKKDQKGKQAKGKQAKQVKAEEPKAEPVRQEPVKKARRPAKGKQGTIQAAREAKPAPQKKRAASKPPRRDRRMPPEPPRKNQPKDSTEQASLMKPYYLDIDR